MEIIKRIEEKADAKARRAAKIFLEKNNIPKGTPQYKRTFERVYGQIFKRTIIRSC